MIEVSNDGCKWTEIDRREFDEEMNFLHVASFSTAACDEMYRLIRIRQIGKRQLEWFGVNKDKYSYLLDLCAFEIFGWTQRIEERELVNYIPVNFSDPLNGIMAHMCRGICVNASENVAVISLTSDFCWSSNDEVDLLSVVHNWSY